MTNSKHTKRALLCSVIALILCCSMLVGTTFAWFTDSVSSVNNVIKAGNLDVELYYNNGTEYVPVTADTNLLASDLWEPGHVQVVNLKIANLGTLALKYQFNVSVVSETGSINKAGEPFKLSDHINFAIIEGEFDGDRKAAVAAAEANAVKVSELNWTVPGEMEPNAADEYVTLVVWMPETVGNEANYRTGEAVPTITLGVNLAAAQLMSEEDSFGPDYDDPATFIPAWDGAVGDVPAEDEGVITITTAAELAAFAAEVNGGTSYSGKTVKLGADINLDNIAWTPIGAADSTTYFQGTFDGQGHTIYGLNVDKSTDTYMHTTAGLFGWVDAASATVKNVNVDGATVKGSHWVGVIAGYWTGTIENCSVNNATVIGYNVNDNANGDKVGGIVGYMNSGAGKLDGNTVTNSTITGYRDVAGLAGAVATSNTVTNNKVENVVVIYSTDYVGEIVSPKTDVTVNDTNTAANVTIAKGIQVNNREELLALSAKALTANNSVAEEVAILINADIDLNGADFSAIIAQRGDKLTIIGNGHTISNVNIVSGENDNTTGQASMFYAYPGSTLTVSNLTLENITVTTEGDNGYGAAVIGYCEGAAVLNNVDVVNANITASKSSGVLVGHLSAGGSLTAADCDVSGAITITEYEADGHYAGKYIGTLAGTASLTRCSADVTIGGNLHANNIGAVYGRSVSGTIEQTDCTTYTASSADLIDALENGGNVVMTEDVTYQGSVCAYGVADTVVNGGTLNGNGQTLSVTAPTNPNSSGYYDYTALSTTGGTIENLNIDNGFRAVFLENMTKDVYLKDMKIGGEGVCYAINTGVNTGEYSLIVTDCEIYGWTSFAQIKSASFTNCVFGQGGYYDDVYGRVVKPYVNTTFDNCSFTEHMNLDLSALEEGQRVTFVNCTVNGQPVTADVFTVAQTNDDYETKLFTVDLPSGRTLEDCVIFK